MFWLLCGDGANLAARTRTLAITGLPESPELNRVVTRDGRALALPPDGLVLSQMLGGILGVEQGDLVQVSVLEGKRPVLVDDQLLSGARRWPAQPGRQ